MTFEIDEVRLPLLQAHLEMARVEARLRHLQRRARRKCARYAAVRMPERMEAWRAVEETVRQVRQLLLALRRRADAVPVTNWQMTIFRRVAASLEVDATRRAHTGFGRGAFEVTRRALEEATVATFRAWRQLPEVRQLRENEVRDWRAWLRVGGGEELRRLLGVGADVDLDAHN